MPFGSLWLPVVVSAIAVFLLSSVLHMVLKYHKADYKKLTNEDAIREVMGKAKLMPGLYVTPYCDDHKQMAEPAFVEKREKGPVGFITIAPNGQFSMGKQLFLWFLVALLVSFLASYVARHSLLPTTAPREAMRITSVVAFGCYGVSSLINSVWMMQPWGNTARSLFDALVYAMATGAAFYFLWPSA